MKITLSTFTGLALVAFAGCESHNDHYISRDDPHRANIMVPSIDKSFDLVGNGKPPLSLIVHTGGWVKIVDVTVGELIHTGQIPPTNGSMVIMLDPNAKAVTYTVPPVKEPGVEPKPAKAEVILPIDPEHTFEVYYQR